MNLVARKWWEHITRPPARIGPDPSHDECKARIASLKAELESTRDELEAERKPEPSDHDRVFAFATDRDLAAEVRRLRVHNKALDELAVRLTAALIGRDYGGRVVTDADVVRIVADILGPFRTVASRSGSGAADV